MSDQSQQPVAPASAPVQVHRIEVAPVAPQAPAPTPPRGDDDFDAFRSELGNMTPKSFKKLKEKLEERGEERAIKTLLRDLGIDDKNDRKAALRDIAEGHMQLSKKAQADAEAAAKATAELQKKEQLLSMYESEAKSQAEEAFKALPDKEQKLVTRFAGEDPLARLKLIRELRADGTLSAPAVPAPVKPATTIAPSGPTPPPASGTLTPQQQYDNLKAAGNNIAAANFARVHPDVKRHK